MGKILFITGYIGIILASNESPDAPNLINWLGCLMILASIMIHKLSKEK
jgi:hypothetical protein